MNSFYHLGSDSLVSKCIVCLLVCQANVLFAAEFSVYFHQRTPYQGRLLLTLGSEGAYVEFTPHTIHPYPPSTNSPYEPGFSLLNLIHAPPNITYFFRSLDTGICEFYMLTYKWGSYNAAVSAHRIMVEPGTQDPSFKYHYNVMTNASGKKLESDEQQENYLNFWAVLYQLLSSEGESAQQFSGKRVVEHLFIHSAINIKDSGKTNDSWIIQNIDVQPHQSFHISFEPVSSKTISIHVDYGPVIKGRSQGARIQRLTLEIKEDLVLKVEPPNKASHPIPLHTTWQTSGVMFSGGGIRPMQNLGFTQ